MDIAIDIDGVCYEWEKTARYMMRAYRGWPASGPMGRESDSWDYIQDNVSKEDWKWLWTEGVRLGLFRFGHLTTGAIVGLQSLVADGHHIIAVTHRPSQAIRDTNAWLTLMDLPWYGQHILTNQEPKSSVEADILVDDKMENIEEWEATTGKPGILFGREWNRDYDTRKYFRVEGWPAVLAYVETLGRY